ncbi:hypothetical protein MMC16_003535 [Acarospora aff. strigata]|nr:hypothetical protein [Acarospora aff. strigata]
MQLLSSSYIIRNVDTVLGEGYELTAGRVEWHEAIQQTFGSVGISLLGTKHTFGLFLGSMAQIFSGVAHADPSLLENLSPTLRSMYSSTWALLTYWRGYNTNTYGRGYVTFASTTFPELLDLKSNMDTCLDKFKPYTSTISDLEIASSNLAKMCRCQSCEDESYSNKSRFCVLQLAETIAVLIWSLSQVTLEVNIKPTRSGLEHVYSAWCNYKSKRAEGPCFVHLLQYLQRATILQTVEAVFTGTIKDQFADEHAWEPHRQRDDSRIAACSTKGLCFYVGTLARLTDQPGGAAHLHVLPGVIELKSGRRYQRISDMNHPSQGYEAKSCKPLDKLDLNTDTSTADLRVDLILKETELPLL